jgi:hypothetical protein
MQQLTEGREIWRVNSFSERPFAGNPAGVVPDADGLSDAQMQSIAAELNDVSETVFIVPADTGDADLRLRFFTSTRHGGCPVYPGLDRPYQRQGRNPNHPRNDPGGYSGAGPGI